MTSVCSVKKKVHLCIAIKQQQKHTTMKKIFSTRNMVVLGGILVFAPFVVAVFSLLHF